MEIVADQGEAPEWTGIQQLNFCTSCEELGYVPASEYGPWILTYGEDEPGM